MNIVTNTTRQHVISLFNTAIGASLIGWGTGAGTSAVTDTTLFSEVTAERGTATQSIITTNISNDTVQAVATLMSLSGGTYTNVGWFDASGNLISKGDFTGILLSTGSKMQITFKLVSQ